MKTKLPIEIMDIAISISILFLILTPIIFPNLSSQPILSVGISVYAGLLMIFNDKIKLISRIGQYANWVAMNLWKPRTKYNNSIVGIFIIAMGFIGYVNFKTTTNEEGRMFEYPFEFSWEYWSALLTLISVNMLIGMILYQRKI